MKNREKLEEVVLAAKDKGVPIRIGVNSGSVRSEGDHEALPSLMVKTVMQYCEHFESLGFRDIVLSLKASDVPSTLSAYRLIATPVRLSFAFGCNGCRASKPGNHQVGYRHWRLAFRRHWRYPAGFLYRRA